MRTGENCSKHLRIELCSRVWHSTLAWHCAAPLIYVPAAAPRPAGQPQPPPDAPTKLHAARAIAEENTQVGWPQLRDGWVGLLCLPSAEASSRGLCMHASSSSWLPRPPPPCAAAAVPHRECVCAGRPALWWPGGGLLRGTGAGSRAVQRSCTCWNAAAGASARQLWQPRCPFSLLAARPKPVLRSAQTLLLPYPCPLACCAGAQRRVPRPARLFGQRPRRHGGRRGVWPRMCAARLPTHRCLPALLMPAVVLMRLVCLLLPPQFGLEPATHTELLHAPFQQ